MIYAKTVWVPMPKLASLVACCEVLHMEEVFINISQINEAINPLIKDWEFVV